MTITINPQTTFSRLSKIFPIVNATTVLPILEYTLLTVMKDHVVFTTNDLETVAKVKIPAQVSEIKSGTHFAIDAKQIISYVKNCDKTEDIIMVFDKTHVTLKCAGFSAKMLMENPGNFPVDPKMDDVVDELKFVQKDLIEILKNSLKFVSNDDLRPSMTGVYMHKKDDTVMVVSTDAHALYHKAIKPGGNFKDFSFIVPRKPIQVLNTLPAQDSVSLSYNANHVKMVSGDFTIFTRLIDARYPDYRVVIPQLESSLYMKRKQLLSFLKMSIPFTNKSTGQLVFEFDSKGESVKISGNDSDFSFDCMFSVPFYNSKKINDDFTVAFNVAFFIKGLECSKDENVLMKTSMSPTKAIILDETTLIMPLMLNQ